MLVAACAPPPPKPVAHSTTLVAVGDISTGFTSRGTIRYEDEAEMHARRPGIVNAVEVTTGMRIEDGTKVFEIDGQGVFAIDTDTVLWRPLVYGDSGDDVRALQEFLIREGHLTDSPDSSYGSQTRSAVKRWQASTGQEVTGSIPSGVLIEWPSGLSVSHIVQAGVRVDLESYLLRARGDLQTLNIELTGAQINQLEPEHAFRFDVDDGVIAGLFTSMLTTEFLSEDGELLHLVEVQLDAGTELPVGLGGPVEIVQETYSDVLLLPVDAIYAAPDGSPAVWRESASGDLEQIPVELGISDGSTVQLLDSSLPEGTSVIIVP